MKTMQHVSSTFMSSSSCSSTKSSSFSQSRMIKATINMPKLQNDTVSLIPKLPTNRALVQEMDQYMSTSTSNSTSSFSLPKLPLTFTKPNVSDHDQGVITKMYAIMEAVADRVEMHKNVGEQRDNWNNLLLTSINAITLCAATMAGIASACVVPGASLAALKIASTSLYLGATGLLIIMNKIQPSQLAEEQRNATRLFKQLLGEIQTKIAIGNPSVDDVNEAMEKVLALDRAYPLPLLGKMLEKFPSKAEPAVWWSRKQRRVEAQRRNGENGWDAKLEGEMREIIRVLEIKDKDDYLKLGEKALKLNKMLAMAGPILTGLGAIGCASNNGSWGVGLGVVAGAMASVVNTLEHGGQVGMVVEMYRSNAGFFKLMEESIESNLNERDVGRRENGELFEMKVALQLGRSLSELRELAASSRRRGMDIEEFGSKLF